MSVPAPRAVNQLCAHDRRLLAGFCLKRAANGEPEGLAVPIDSIVVKAQCQLGDCDAHSLKLGPP